LIQVLAHTKDEVLVVPITDEPGSWAFYWHPRLGHRAGPTCVFAVQAWFDGQFDDTEERDMAIYKFWREDTCADVGYTIEDTELDRAWVHDRMKFADLFPSAFVQAVQHVFNEETRNIDNIRRSLASRKLEMERLSTTLR
jgi:hypothetical protein